MKLTGWYSGDQKPVRVGVYQRKALGEIHYSYWNGVWWGVLSDTKKNAFLYRDMNSYGQYYPWRGVSK